MSDRKNPLVAQHLGHLQRPDVAVRHPHVLGLPAGVTAVEVAVAKQPCTRGGVLFVEDGAASRIGVLAGREQGFVAIEAGPAGDDERHHHAITRAQRRHCRAHLFHDTHEFMAEDVAVLHARDLSPVDVQVRAADGRGSDAQQHIVLCEQHGVGHVFHAHVLGALVGERFHAITPSMAGVTGRTARRAVRRGFRFPCLRVRRLRSMRCSTA